MTDTHYTPSRIDHWLTSWQELVALSETETLSAPTLDRATIPQEHAYRPESSLQYTVIKADIERAWDSLGPHTFYFKLVYLRMQGYHLKAIGDLLGRQYHATERAYQQSIARMARYLGWG